MKKTLICIVLTISIIAGIVSCDGNVSKSKITPINSKDDVVFTVTFDTKDGSSVSSQNIIDGNKATKPANDPTKLNYGFFGWTTDANAYTTSADFDFNTPITSNITLYAKWAFAKGIASTSDANRPTCVWVQLWAGGPKFAEFNIGATITDYSQANQTFSGISSNINDPLYCKANVGGLYTWGGTQDARTSYTDDHYNVTDTDIQGTEHDTAKNLWGSNWKMPTKDQLTSLTDSNVTTCTWCDGNTSQTDTGCTLAGYKVSGLGEYANNSIFLPAAGLFDFVFEGFFVGAEESGCYWSTTPGPSDGAGDYAFADNTDEISNPETTQHIRNGVSVRAVLAD